MKRNGSLRDVGFYVLIAILLIVSIFVLRGGMSAGDQVTYYLTGEKKKVSVVDNAKLLSEAPAGERDENSAFYLNKLEELYANFAEFIRS